MKTSTITTLAVLSAVVVVAAAVIRVRTLQEAVRRAEEEFLELDARWDD